jgi:L-2-hydroxyglutarate oxidase LhgO
MPDSTYDTVVIGAGVVGLAVAHELLRRRPSQRVAVLDKEEGVGRHQTGRNSGVVHSGLMYRPGSLKARLCIEGRSELRRFCGEHSIPYRETGKIIVAVRHEEIARLQALLAQGRTNGVPGLELLGPAEMRQHEPNVQGIAGIWCPSTAVVDFGLVATALAGAVVESGGALLLGQEAMKIVPQDLGAVIETTGGRIQATRTVVCAGLQTDRLAGTVADQAGLRIVPFRGNYFVLSPRASRLVRSMVNPVPDPRLPFVGVHFTRLADGRVLVGPNAVVSLAREKYDHWSMNLGDAWSTISWRGFWLLALRYWAVGLREMWEDSVKTAYLASVRRYLPDIEMDDLLPGPVGIRAQAVTRSGRLLDDFSIAHTGSVTYVMNAPSPAATSAFSIAREIVDRLDGARSAGQ